MQVNQCFSVMVMLLSSCVAALNFPYESLQLSSDEVASNPSLWFGNDTAQSLASANQTACKAQPDDPSWPSIAEWIQLNQSLSGHLLHPRPVGRACYPGPEFNNDTCSFLLGPATTSSFFLDDPLSVLTLWAEDSTCLVTANTTGRTCTQGAYPSYVVNATSVKDIQLAVNFARNQNIRLVIKNTGHDFLGRSAGSASLSIWTHWLKGFEYVPDYSIGQYHGPAAKLSAGFQTWEANNAMVAASNFTIAIPIDYTVGTTGGWMMGGGHGILTSLRGLGADQVLSMNVVLANGTLVTADVTQNQDLFFALRGGGGSTFGIVTSAIVKAVPRVTTLSGLNYVFTTGPTKPASFLPNRYPVAPVVDIPDVEVFWKAVNAYLTYAEKIVEAGGLGYGDAFYVAKDSYYFSSTFAMPEMTADQVTDFIKPLFDTYRALGVNTTTPKTGTINYPIQSNSSTSASYPGSPADRLVVSRLLPKSLWNSLTAINQTVAILRHAVEDGNRFATRAYRPDLKKIGYPSNSTDTMAAVNPAMRNMIIHCTIFKQDSVSELLPQSPKEWKAAHDGLSARADELRALTPDSGAYYNELDSLEPDWKKSVFGSNYARLLSIKEAVDPTGLFWAPRTVGSDAWYVKTGDEVPTQNGPLCRWEGAL